MEAQILGICIVFYKFRNSVLNSQHILSHKHQILRQNSVLNTAHSKVKLVSMAPTP